MRLQSRPTKGQLNYTTSMYRGDENGESENINKASWQPISNTDRQKARALKYLGCSKAWHWEKWSVFGEFLGPVFAHGGAFSKNDSSNSE